MTKEDSLSELLEDIAGAERLNFRISCALRNIKDGDADSDIGQQLAAGYVGWEIMSSFFWELLEVEGIRESGSNVDDMSDLQKAKAMELYQETISTLQTARPAGYQELREMKLNPWVHAMALTLSGFSCAHARDEALSSFDSWVRCHLE